jgi:hypothetical protein
MAEGGRFSDAARAYAEHWGVVDAVAKQFNKEVDDFFDALRQRVQDVLPQLKEKKVQSGGSRYWCLADSDRSLERHPQLLFGSVAERPEIVTPGRLRVLAIAPTASKEQLPRLVAVAEDTALRPYAQKLSGGTWSLFRLVLPCGGQNAVEQVAAILVAALTALDGAFRDGSR